jgi:hypothetical protein
MIQRAFKGALAACLVCWCLAAHAHQFHLGITDVTFNPKTGNTEIVHTYMAHDIEALLSNLYQRQFDLTQPEDEAILRKYVEKQFWVQGEDKRRLPVQWVGLTAGAENVVIYQEIVGTPLSKVALVHDEVLIDFLAAQANTLNINISGATKTFTFDRKAIDQAVR